MEMTAVIARRRVVIRTGKTFTEWLEAHLKFYFLVFVGRIRDHGQIRLALFQCSPMIQLLVRLQRMMRRRSNSSKDVLSTNTFKPPNPVTDGNRMLDNLDSYVHRSKKVEMKSAG